jgi:hypothetical protein
MKKLVLFVAIGAAVALSACKKEAPATAPEEPQIEVPAVEPVEPVVTEEPAATEDAAVTEEAAPAPVAE